MNRGYNIFIFLFFVQENIRHSIFLYINQNLLDLRKIYALNLKTGRLKKLSHVGEFESWDLSKIVHCFPKKRKKQFKYLHLLQRQIL